MPTGIDERASSHFLWRPSFMADFSLFEKLLDNMIFMDVKYLQRHALRCSCDIEIRMNDCETKYGK